MRTLIIEIPRDGATIAFHLSPGGQSGQVVVVIPDGVEIGALPRQQETATVAPAANPFREWQSPNGFPPRAFTEQAITQILHEHAGQVKIRDEASGWNIYDEIAARLGVPIQARRRLTVGTGEPAWRPEVGFARKNLEQQGIIAPTEKSGRGVWQLAKKGT